MVEIARIDEQHGPITEFPGEVYERDLERNRARNQSIELTPSEGFKRCGTLDIAVTWHSLMTRGPSRASTLPGYADGYGHGIEDQTAMEFLEEIVTAPSNRFHVECLHQLAGDERFCSNYGPEFR